MTDPFAPVGFDYCGAALDLLRVMTYERLAEALGYQSKGSVSQILDGAVPSHVQGEALWALYLQTFNRKPPMSVRQSGQQTGDSGT